MGASAQRKFAFLRSRRCQLIVLGLVFYWPLFRAPFLGTVFSDAVDGAAQARMYYEILIGVVGLAMLLTPSKGRLSNAAFSPAAGTLCALLVSAGAASFLILTGINSGFWVLILGTLLLLLGVAGLTLQWASCVGSLEIDEAGLCLALSFAMSFAAGLLDPSRAALAVAALVLPLVSAAFLAASQAPCEKAGAIAESEKGDSSAGGSPEGSAPREGLTIGWGLASLVGCAVAGMIATSFLRSLWMYDAVGYSAVPQFALTYAVSVSEAVALLFVFLLGGNRRVSAAAGLMILMIVLTLGIAAYVFVGPMTGLALTGSSRTLLEFFLWALVAVYAGRDRSRMLHGFCLFFVVESATALLSIFVLPALLGIGESTSPELALKLSLCGLGLIAIALILLMVLLMRNVIGHEDRLGVSFDSAAGDEAQPSLEGGAGGSPTVDPLAAALGEAYSLTEREAEIAACMARGNSVKRTAELLCLAPSTVQGYTKSIYRKMGITKKQALVDLAAKL